MAVLSSNDLDAITRIERLREAAANAVDPAVAQRLAAFHSSYPWMSPDVKWSLSKAGLDPSSSTGQAAAYAAAHLEVNQGLGFQSYGSPVTRPATAPNTSDVFAALEQKRQQQYAPPADPNRYAAPAQGPSALQQMVGDEEWNKLAPNEQAELAKIQIVQGAPEDLLNTPDQTTAGPNQNVMLADAEQVAKYRKDNAQVYKIVGWDQLQPFWREKVGDLVAKATGAFKLRKDLPVWTGQDSWFQDGVAITGHHFGISGKTSFDILQSIAPIERPAFMLASAPLQELTGQFRNVYALAHGKSPDWTESQSDLGVAISQDGLNPMNWQAGEGVFIDPNSPVAQERQRRLLERGQIGGHAITVGRALANAVHLDPNTKPFYALSGVVDLAFALKADPSARALKFGAEADAASKLIGSEGSVGAAVKTYRQTGEVLPAFNAFTDAGGLAGIKPTVNREAVNTWIDAAEQRPMLDALAGETNGYKVWRALNRKVDPTTADAIAGSSNPDDVANLLRGEIGSTLREKFDAADVLNVRAKTPSRWVSMMPHDSVDGYSGYANALEVERFAALTKAPSSQLESWFSDMAKAASPAERQQVWAGVMDDTYERLLGSKGFRITSKGIVREGVDAGEARKLVHMYGDAETDSVYATREVAAGRGNFDNQAIVDGQPAMVTQNRPTMLAQTLDGNIPLPDPRALRRALSPLRDVYNNDAVQGAEHLLNGAQKVWKGLQIITVKTAIKVVADEQAGIAARGYDSLINHPLSALSIILATPLSELPEDAGFIARLQHASSKLLRGGLEHVPGVEPELTTTALGHDFGQLDEIQKIAAYGFDSTVHDRGLLHANDWKVLYRKAGVNDAEFLQAHGRHLAQYAASPETRAFARAESLADAQFQYWQGPLQKYRERLAQIARPELATKEGSDAYVAEQMAQMRAVTNDNPTLMQAIRDGELEGTPIWTTGRDGTPQVSRNFLSKLDAYQNDFPTATPQQKGIYSADLAHRQVVDGIFNRFIHGLLGTPSAVLSKSPLFRQAYWERIIDNAPVMTADAQNEVLRVARNEANLPDKLVNELSDAITRSNRSGTPFSGTLELEHADEIAKGHALDIVRRTTHEFSDRSQAFDMLRLLTPFGEVWRKTIKRWANIVRENPQTVRRLQQGIEGARGEDLGAFLGAPAGQGFFHKDAYGQEVFSIPGSEWATQALVGAPVPLVGNVKGLSVGTEFFPALGPVASIPVAWTMEKLHLMDQQTPLGTLGETLFPYGPPENLGDAWNYAPTWFKTAFGPGRPTSPDSVRTFNNSVIDMVRYGLTNGDYDLSTPEGVQHAIDDAEGKAHALYRIRAAAQFLIPGSPSPQFLLRDKTGKLVDAAALIDEYHKLSNDNPDTAGQEFLDKYGPDIFAAITPKSYTYIYGLPTSPDSAKWVDDHPDLKRDFPHIYGYFAPPSDPKDFDYEVYKEQLQPGEGRDALSPQQWAQIANSRLAGIQYGRARDRVDALNNGKPPNDAQRAWLATVKQNLMEQYPGYREALYGGSGLPGKVDSEEAQKVLAVEAAKAVDDPTVKNTDAGQGLATYLSKRAEIDDAWTAAGYTSGSWASSAGTWAIQLRAYLRRFAGFVTEDHPLFGPLFDGVFDREMRDDTVPGQLTPSGVAA